MILKDGDLFFKISGLPAGCVAQSTKSSRAGKTPVKDPIPRSANCRNLTRGSFHCADLWMHAEILHLYMSIYFPYDCNAGNVQQENINAKGGRNAQRAIISLSNFRTIAIRRRNVILLNSL